MSNINTPKIWQKPELVRLGIMRNVAGGKGALVQGGNSSKS